MTSNIQLYQGDCLEVMKNIPDKSIDLVLTDPPFGTTSCSWDSVIPLEPMWEQIKRITKPKSAIVLFGCQPFTSVLVSSNTGMFKYECIFEKSRPSNPALAKHRPLSYHENVLIFYKEKGIYNPQMSLGNRNHGQGTGIRNKSSESNMPTATRSYMNNPDSKLKYPKSIVKFDRGEIQVHPTQKPVALMEYLIKTYSNEGMTVLDFCAGSGTTGVAAKNLNRDFIGIEMDEGYFKIAKERIEKV